MPTKSITQDRKRASSERHELDYAGRQLGKGGKAAVVQAKKSLGRVTARRKVMTTARRGS